MNLTASATIKNPQTFNRYSYVLNSPYKFTDPLGLLAVTTGACGTSCPGSGGVGGYSGNYDSGHRNGPQELQDRRGQVAAFFLFVYALTGSLPTQQQYNDAVAGRSLSTRSGANPSAKAQNTEPPVAPPTPPFASEIAGSPEFQEWEKDVGFTPFQTFEGYPDGTPFSSAEEAAVFILQFLQPISILLDREIAATVFEKNKRIQVMVGAIGTQNSSKFPRNIPEGAIYLAIAHTHGRKSGLTPDPYEDFSKNDKFGSNMLSVQLQLLGGKGTPLLIPDYMATPSGKIKKFIPSGVGGTFEGVTITTPFTTTVPRY